MFCRCYQKKLVLFLRTYCSINSEMGKLCHSTMSGLMTMKKSSCTQALLPLWRELPWSADNGEFQAVALDPQLFLLSDPLSAARPNVSDPLNYPRSLKACLLPERMSNSPIKAIFVSAVLLTFCPVGRLEVRNKVPNVVAGATPVCPRID